MTSLALSVVLQASIVATGAQTYKEAYRETAETGRPLVVLVGADWCPGCVQMKNAVIPQLEKRGTLRKVAFTAVNTDQQGDLARKLMRGGSIPQLIVFRKTAKGWSREQFTGARSVKETERFISRGSEPPGTPLTARQ